MKRNKFLLVSLFAMLMIGLVLNVQATPDELWLSVSPYHIMDLTAPETTNWDCLYSIPTGKIGNIYHLVKWVDSNGDLRLSASDQIYFDDGSVWHVDEVMVTIHWTWKEPVPPDFDPAEPPATEPIDPTQPIEMELPPPVGSKWHMIYPIFCRPFTITSWTDNDGSETFNPSDQFDITFDDDGTGPWWAHLDAISTDIKITKKYPPPPQTPEFPLGLGVAMGLGLTVAVVYMIRKRRPTVSPA